MKTQLKRQRLLSLSLITALLISFCPVSAKADSKYTYTTTESGTLAITGYTGDDAYLVIPDEIDGTKVTEIADHAFEYNTTIRKLTIPDGVTEIGEAAFNDCTNLSEANLPDSLTSIGKDAFFSCTRLDLIALPSELESLGDGAFYHCYSLKAINVPGSVTDFGDYVFGACTALASAWLEEGITEVPQQTFFDCSKLTDVSLPQSVEVIGMRAFEQCTALTAITLPDHLERIEKRAFDQDPILSLEVNAEVIECRAFSGASFESLALGSDVREIQTHAFPTTLSVCQVNPENASYATDDKGVVYSKDGKELVFCPPSSSFFSQESDYQVPEGVEKIDAYAFNNCYMLEYVSLPDTLVSIGEHAFDYTAISDLQLPESLNELGDYAFSSNSSLENIIIPSGITELPVGVFSNCGLLSSVTFHGDVTKISDFAFKNCANLNEFYLPASLNEVSGSAFIGCGVQEELTADSLTEQDPVLSEETDDRLEPSDEEKELLDRKVESYNTALKEANGTSGFTLTVDEQNPSYSIGEDGSLYNKTGDTLVFYVFQNKETSYSVPDSVSTIKEYAIYPSYLKEVHIPDSVTTFEENAIQDPITIYGNEGSNAQDYAKSNNFAYFTGTVETNAEELSLLCGDTFQLEISGIPDDCLVYTSSDNRIVSVDQSGLITAKANGSVDIYAVNATYKIRIPVTASGGSDPEDPYASYKVFSSSQELNDWENSYVKYNQNVPMTDIDNININDYSSNNYIAIKAHLIGGSYIDQCNSVFEPGGYEQFSTVTKNLNHELSRFKLNTDLKVYSGTSDISFITGGGSTLEEMVASIGKTVTDPCVISTSMAQQVAASHGTYMLEIYAPHDLTNGAYINPFSMYPSEYELLLNYNLTYQVIDAGIRNVEVSSFPDADWSSSIEEYYIKLLVNPQPVDPDDPDQPDDPDEPVTPDPDEPATPGTPDQPSKPDVNPSDNTSKKTATGKKNAAKTGDPLDLSSTFALFVGSGGLLLIVCGNIYRRKGQR